MVVNTEVTFDKTKLPPLPRNFIKHLSSDEKGRKVIRNGHIKMFNPFDIIPKTIDPFMRNILIVLVSIQFLAFVLFVLIMIYDHIQKKRNQVIATIDNKEKIN